MLVAALFITACGDGRGSSELVDSRDSLSYVIGMNIAYNVLQMDSTVNADVVVAAIDETMRGKERLRRYEEQYLNDLAASDGDVVRTPNGLTYKVAALGDMNLTVATDRDTVALTYRATNLSGEEVDLVAERQDTLRTRVDQLLPGLREGVRLVGEGGNLTLWLPSSMAYGSAGDSEKGIKANEMLRYEVQIVEVKRRR